MKPEDATPPGVSKTEAEIEEENKKAVAEVRNATIAERKSSMDELAAHRREVRDAELKEARYDVEDTDGENGEQPDNGGETSQKQEDQNNSTVDGDEELDILKIDGEEKSVSKSAIYEAGKRAMQKELASDSRLEEATRILNEAKQTAEQMTNASQPSSEDVDDISPVNTEELAKTLVDGDVDEVAEALSKLGIGRQGAEHMATQADGMRPDEVYGLVEGALQMKEAMDLFQADPESGGFGDLYADETMHQMVLSKEAELAQSEDGGNPVERLKKAAGEVREWRDSLVKQSGGTVVDFQERSSKKQNAQSTATSAGGRPPADTEQQPKSEAQKRRDALNAMARSRGQNFD